MSALSKVSPEAIDRNIAAITNYATERDFWTQKTMGVRMGMSASMVGGYMNEAVSRGLLVVVGKKRPIKYALPENQRPDVASYEATGKNENLTIYVDEAICKKIEALSVYHHGHRYGGQGKLITNLVNAQFEALVAKGVDFNRLAQLHAEIDEIVGREGERA